MAQRARRHPARHDRDVVRITTAGASAHEDMAGRQRRYLISMGLRVLCFVGAVAVGPGWLRWVLVAGAVFLPWVAVVMANAAAGRGPELDLPEVPRQRPQLGPGDPDER